ncbi:MAG: hypothetical protein ABGX83_08315 [Nitrospira sp.]|nr:hypothetical protein [Candidatus Manganitrophaceae bacterium]HIL34187.1 hypothetical protein [Candidatus Manganitrophaceae bacterium]
MSDQKKKAIFSLVIVVCLGGGAGFLYLGRHFFSGRAVPFWTFSTYIVVLTIIIIFFAYRFIFVHPYQDEEE